MIGQPGPVATAMDLSALNVKATHINAIQSQDGQARRKTASRTPAGRLEYFVGTDFPEGITSAMPPVVEIASEDQRRILGYQRIDACADSFHLLAPGTAEQTQMHTDTVQVRWPAGNLDLGVQQPALLETIGGNVLMIAANHRETRQDCVAVVTVFVDCVASVGSGRPLCLRQKLMLGCIGPGLMPFDMLRVVADNLLQEDDVGPHHAQALPHIVHHNAAIEVRKALVNVVGRHRQRRGFSVRHEVKPIATARRRPARGQPCYALREMPDYRFSDLLRQRTFVQFWTTRLAGTAANQMLMVAVGWQMYELTGSAWDLGLVGLYQFLPALVLTLVAGYVADRVNRARIVAACLVVQLIAAGVLALASYQFERDAGTPSLPAQLLSRDLLLAVSVLLGVARAFQMPAQQALIALLVPTQLLPRAMAFSASGLQAAVIAGPAVGGVIYVAGAAAVYGTCALLFALGMVLALCLRYEHSPPRSERPSMATLLAGVRFIFERKLLLGAISLDLFAVLLGGATALLPMFARDILHVGAWGLGLLRGAPAVGALMMSIALTRWPVSQGVGKRLLAAVAVFGIATVVFGVSTNFLLSLIALAITGAADMVSVVIRQTLVQLETPDDMRGRVSAVNSVFIGASNQLGEFESGATAAWLGPVGSVVVGGLGTVAVALAWLRWFPTLAQRDSLQGDGVKPG